jgi:hypothetical protein
MTEPRHPHDCEACGIRVGVPHDATWVPSAARWMALCPPCARWVRLTDPTPAKKENT